MVSDSRPNLLSKGQEIKMRNTPERLTKMNAAQEIAKSVFQPIQSFTHSTSPSTLVLFTRNCPRLLLNTTLHAA
jgi:hypothetical protein